MIYFYNSVNQVVGQGLVREFFCCMWHQLVAGLNWSVCGFPHVSYFSVPMRGLSTARGTGMFGFLMWFLVSKREKRGELPIFLVSAVKEYHFHTSCWSEQVTRPARIQGAGK